MMQSVLLNLELCNIKTIKSRLISKINGERLPIPDYYNNSFEWVNIGIFIA